MPVREHLGPLENMQVDFLRVSSFYDFSLEYCDCLRQIRVTLRSTKMCAVA